MEVRLNWLTILLIWDYFVHRAYGLRCYACFHDEVTGMGHSCERPNNREFITNCRSQKDVDKALEYIGVKYESERQSTELEHRGDNSNQSSKGEEKPQFVCILVRGDFQNFKLGSGILRSCWKLPKDETISCGDIQLVDGDNRGFDGCYCAKNHKDGQPCNGEHKFSLAEEDEIENGLSIQARYKGAHDNDDDDSDGEHTTKAATSDANENANPNIHKLVDYLMNAVAIVIIIAVVELILLLFEVVEGLDAPVINVH